MTKPDDTRNNLVPVPPPFVRNESLASKARTWTVTVGIAAVLLGAMYGVTTHRAEVQDEQRHAEMQKDAAPPAGTLQRPPS